MTIDQINQLLRDADLLVSEEDVKKTLERLAEEITLRLQKSKPVVMTVMNGGLVFAGQLLTKLVFPMEVDYVHATRYGDNTRGDTLNWIVKPQTELKGKTVLLLDDILDEGITLAAIADYCRRQGAAEVLMAVLVEKLHLRKVTPGMRADFTGVEVGDRFVLGYGLDYKGYWRNAPGIFAVKGK
ncbi:MAG: hypoxanthine-guanine phosphoribosyltransferase [Desulfuromonadaceae bacterium]|nr:hypoxanthine-guanine phosphoribosyltransferase [Desulfuromonadaceae bacterium]MDD5107660.1 hypoxanthine-guanine phosphoribosyltransferase [Desulfuromonadaceae bacterium]